jgi:glycosyltransferase involved in cell wall biosynthesis
MSALWTTVALRLMATIQPAKLLEVGVGNDEFTEAACLEATRWGGKVISIRRDPHRRRLSSLQVRRRYTRKSISSVGPVDLVVLHGQPNWWTTSWQLGGVQLGTEREGRPLPPIVVANAGQPWGRRDCYEAPDNLPADGRQPGRREGNRWVALDESTPRNGVLTAVEDFADERGGLELLSIPGLGGVALVLDPEAVETLSESARQLIDELRLPPMAATLLEAVDAERRSALERGEEAVNRAAQVDELTGTRDGLQRELAALRSRTRELAAKNAAASVRAKRAESRATLLERIHLRPGPSNNGPGSTRNGTGNGRLSREPSRRLVVEILQPADLVRALGWPGGEDELALPIPVDRRGVVAAAAGRALVVIADRDAGRLRRTMCSVLDHVAEPVALTVIRPAVSSEPTDRLLAALEVAAPQVALADARTFRPRPGAQRLIAGEELPWGWPAEPEHRATPSVAYLLPGIPAEGSGGAHSVVQEARGLRDLGAGAIVCVPADSLAGAGRLYGNRDSLFVSYDRTEDLLAAVGGATVAVATEHTSVPLLAWLVRRRPELGCAYYVQDYEPLFAELGSPRSDRALLSYGAIPQATLFAKSHFVRNVVGARHGVSVAKVAPSLDRSMFNADDRSHRIRRQLTVIVMLRPRTPRRRPQATLAALSLIGAALGDDVELVSFGCDGSELDALDGEGADVRHLGRLRPTDVANELRRSDVFLDGSAYQAFGRTGLEATACGAVPVLPSLGGTSEYAVDGKNAVLLQDDQPRVLADAVIRLARDRARLERLRTAGIKDATHFSVARAARSQLDLFSRLQSRSATVGERANR